MLRFVLDKRVKGNPDALAQRVSQLDPNTKWEVVAKPYKSQRSLQQNDWARKYARDASKYFGYTPDEMYDILMYKHNPVFITDKVTGEVIRMNGHFSKLKTDEAAVVQEAILRWGVELGFVWEGE
jgi:hypothetical protein